MSVIEGVGDEVLVVVGAFLLVCLMLLAWFSTHTRDIPLVSVIVVELSQRRMRNRNNANNNTSEAGETSASESVTENGSDTATENGESTEQLVSSNNNADTFNENGEEAASVTDSNPPEAASSSTVAAGDTQSGENDSSNSVPCESENTNMNSGNVEEELTPTETETISTIPPYRPQAESSDEVRRRRVAYFENNTGQDRSDTQRDSGSLGAQSEDSASIRTGEMTQTQGRTLDVSSSNANKTPTFSNTDGATASTETPVSSSSPVSPSKTKTPTTSPLPSASQDSATHVTESTRPASTRTQSGSNPGDTRTGSSSGGPQSGSPAAGAQVSEALGREEEEEGEDSASQQIRVRLKYLNDTQRLVYAHPQETVGNFRRLHFSSELEDDKIVRFIFNGQDLRNDLSTLRAYNIADNSVVHCLITQNRRHETQAGREANRHDGDVHMGTLLFPVFGIILGLVWYLRFSYKQYFNAMSTVSLAGVSFIYLLAFFSSTRQRRHPRQHLD